MVYQLSIFLENKPNRLYGLTHALEKASVNMHAAMIAETGDFGIVRIIVDDPDRAHDALKNEGFTVKKTHVIGVEAPDGPGTLSEIAHVLGKNGINIQYIYAFSLSGRNKACFIIRTDSYEDAKALIHDDLGLRTFSHKDLGTL